MARKKVRIAYITNNSARRATFRKRKEGMMKKLRELTTLCGIDACAVIYSPFDSQPEVWPSPFGVKHVLEKFKNMSLIEKSQKMLNQESFLRELISKKQIQLKKLRKENKEKQMRRVMFESLTLGVPQFQHLNLMDMGVLQQLIYQKLDEIDGKTKNLNEKVIDNENQTA
ncbi:PREDICTED: agamous-like MADS-box protein AGL80 [Fragaria vesca subsp. vesca]|uniref:agamous-like MADS-box protein AGL80 n=1 Tax=Fragaria vesca subsp. vesca TaxID=101020 RepID=UPI0002C2EC12|nr:PREDICTED: agamous-like MADS-box protein AGL80 [Fragaria vesca subsp. vesca]